MCRYFRYQRFVREQKGKIPFLHRVYIWVEWETERKQKVKFLSSDSKYYEKINQRMQKVKELPGGEESSCSFIKSDQGHFIKMMTWKEKKTKQKTEIAQKAGKWESEESEGQRSNRAEVLR